VDILINNCSIEFELDNEKTLTDIVSSVSQWAAQRNLVFLDVEVDGDSYSLDSIPDMELNDLKALNCLVVSRAELVMSSISEGAAYCERVDEFINNSIDKKSVDISQLNNIISGINWLNDILDRIISLAGVNPQTAKFRDRTLGEYIEKLKSVEDELQSIDNEDKFFDYFHTGENVFQVVREILRGLLLSDEMQSLVIQSIDSPDSLIESLMSIKQLLPEHITNIEETAIAFQTGRDSEGAEKLNRFIEFIYEYTRTCYQVAPVFRIDPVEIEVNELSLEEKNSTLHELLNDIIDIMENNDIISLADILEYEIIPSIEDIDQYIDLLLDVINGVNKEK